VRLRGASGDRVLPVEYFLLLPGDQPERDTVLAAGEMVVEIEISATSWARRSRYLKIRDRASFEFALVSVAVALESEKGRIKVARVAAGGVGTKPWRLTACETVLVGAPLGETTLRAAADHAADGARPLNGNGFKPELLRRAVFRALTEVAGQP